LILAKKEARGDELSCCYTRKDFGAQNMMRSSAKAFSLLIEVYSVEFQLSFCLLCFALNLEMLCKQCAIGIEENSYLKSCNLASKISSYFF